MTLQMGRHTLYDIRPRKKNEIIFHEKKNERKDVKKKTEERLLKKKKFD